MDTPVIRHKLRRQRDALPTHTRDNASRAVVQHIKQLAYFHDARHIAAYNAMGGEVDVSALRHDINTGAVWYVPVIAPGSARHMDFVRMDEMTIMHRNKLGIAEPVAEGNTKIDPAQLDIVFTPLVAFDSSCHRIGMGGGYYDRAFGFLLDHNAASHPLLIGVAHEFQRVPTIEPQPWDVPLAGVVTEQTIYGNITRQ